MEKKKVGLRWMQNPLPGSMKIWTAGPYIIRSSSWIGIMAGLAAVGIESHKSYLNVQDAKTACEEHHFTGKWE
jgi:hypothetical protein